jgi:hypothetical protein
MAQNNGYRLFRVRVRETLYDYEGGDFQVQLRNQGFPEHLLDPPVTTEVDDGIAAQPVT